MLNRFVKIFVLAGVFVLSAHASSADVTLRFSPADTTVEVGSTTRLSIMCDDVIDLRTIEVFVEFDPTIVGSVSGGSGALYEDSGFSLFDGFELTAPNVWHGYCVVMGSTDYITTPGELFFWEFEGLADGVSPITSVSVVLVMPGSVQVPDLTLPPTTITVGNPLSAVPQVLLPKPELRCYPNPFNPRTEVSFELIRNDSVDLCVFDVTGRRVAELYHGETPSGLFSVSWDGCDNQGRVQPAGLYLFRLETSSAVSITKAVLVK